MKKIIITGILTIAILTGSTRSSYALFGVADIVNDPIMTAKQIFQYVSEHASELSNYTTAWAQKIDWLNKNVLVPANNLLTVRTQLSIKKNWLSMIYASTGKDTALFVQNPTQYIQNAKNGVTKAAIGTLTAQDGVSSAAAVKQIIEKTKYDNRTLDAKLKTTNQSNIPKMVQSELCNETALSARAQQDVSDGDGNYELSEYTTRKKELNDKLCGDLTDPNIIANLKVYNETHPSMEAFLALTNGDNDFVRTETIKREVEKAAEAKAEAKQKDLDHGGGNIRSQTDCKTTVQYDVDGFLYDKEAAPCLLENIKLPSIQALNQLIEANNPLPDLRATLGDVAGSLGPLISAFTTALQTASTINGNLGGGTGSGTGQATGGTLPGGTITNTIQTIATGGGTDLRGDAAAKNNLTQTPFEAMNAENTALDQLAEVDRKYLASLTQERSEYEALKNCPTATNFYSSYQASNSGSNSKSSQIAAELSSIATKKDLIRQTKEAVSASESTDVILNLFKNYRSTASQQGLPDAGTLFPARQSEAETFAATLAQSLATDGTLYSVKMSCTTSGGNQGGY